MMIHDFSFNSLHELNETLADACKVLIVLLTELGKNGYLHHVIYELVDV